MAGGSGASSRPGVGFSKESLELISQFDPDDPANVNNMEQWLARVDQLGDIYNWSAAERVLCTQVKLAGAARLWFTHLENYYYSWEEWKAALLEAFPCQFDYGEALTEMLARVKRPGESLIQYYHNKMSLLERVEIRGEKAVSCLILGLPEGLRAGARALKCTNPGALYVEYLSKDSDFRPTATSSRGNPVERTAPRNTPTARPWLRCYNCQKVTDHLSANCPEPRVDRCIICGKSGHVRRKCPRANERFASKRSRGERDQERDERRATEVEQPVDGPVLPAKRSAARDWFP